MAAVTTELDLNMQLPNVAVVSYAVQGDTLYRQITANLYDGSTPWSPPEGAYATVRGKKPDGTFFLYDTDEDENPAVTWSGNVATIKIIQQALAVAGDVTVQINFYTSGGVKITTFSWEMLVQPAALTDTEIISTDYFNILTKQIAGVLGANGHAPFINPTTHNWMLWDTATNAYVDSGYSAEGEKGDTGDTGPQGVSITSIARTSGTGAPGTDDTYTVYLSNNTTAGTFTVHNGSNGRSIGSVVRTSGTGAAGTTDTYTVYLSDNTSVGTFNVYNGADGQGSPGSATPLMDGTASAGSAIAYSREDHVHPSDTTRARTADMASAYSSSATYEVGDLCIYNNVLYRCNTQISTAESWTPAHWTATTVGVELSDLKGSLTNKLFIKSGTISAAHTSSTTTTLATDTSLVDANTDIANVWFSNPAYITSDYTIATNASGQVQITCTNLAPVTVYVVLFNP